MKNSKKIKIIKETRKYKNPYELKMKYRGKRLYHISLAISALLIIVCFIGYLIVKIDSIQNFLGNILAGLLTGFMVTVLTNIRHREMEFYSDILKKYEYCSEEIGKICNLIIEYFEGSYSDIAKIYNDAGNLASTLHASMGKRFKWYNDFVKEHNMQKLDVKLLNDYWKINKLVMEQKPIPKDYEIKLRKVGEMFVDLHVKVYNEIITMSEERLDLKDKLL